MCDRSQSNVVGVILLVSVVTLTVTASGAVILSDWEGDIGDGPTADLDSEVTPVNISVDHRGGETLDPDQTRVEIIGSDETASLDETLEPGGSTEWEFDRLDDSIQLVIVDEPTETVIHRNSETIVNPIEDLWFGVDGWTEPIYLLEGHPANYTVAQEFELGTPHPVTNRANVTVEDGDVTVDEDETTLEGDTAGTEVAGTAEFDNRTTETDIVVLESEPPLEIETESVDNHSITSVEATGDVIDLGGLPEVTAGFTYGLPNRTFVKSPIDNEDKLIADGAYWEDPDGYAHDDDYVHDNVPFEPGDTRTYIYDSSNYDSDFSGSLRTYEQLNANGSISSIDEVDDLDRIKTSPPDAKFELEVTYVDDGSEFVFYLDGEHVETWDGLENYDELYFSSYESWGTSGEDSLRLVAVDPLPENVQTVTVDENKDTETNFSDVVDDIQPDTTYEIQATAEQDIGDKTISDVGGPIEFSTEGPNVETVDSEPSGVTSIDAIGELTDLGDMESANLSFGYRLAHREFVEDPESNEDKLITDGEYWETQNNPDGYAHDDDYIHDNNPIEPGETRNYTFKQLDRHASRVAGSARDHQQKEPNGSINSISRVDNVETITFSPDVNEGEQFVLTVEYTSDGSQMEFYLDGENVDTWWRLDDYDELYFSSYEYLGTDGINSLRLIETEPLPNFEPINSPDDGSSLGNFTGEIDKIDPETTYEFKAITDQEVGGIDVTDEGELQEFSTRLPTVETIETNTTDITRVDAIGELDDIGDMNSTELYFDYGPLYRQFVKDSESNEDKLIADGDFWEDPDGEPGYAHDNDYVHDNVPIEPGETRNYTFDQRGEDARIDGSLRTSEQTQPNGSVDSIEPVDDIEFIADNGLPDDGGTFNLTVEYEYPSIMRFYVDGEEEQTWTGLADYDEVYFSSYEYAGEEDLESLRLIQTERKPGSVENKSVESLQQEDEFDDELSIIQPDTPYDVTAYTNQTVDHVDVVDEGDPIEFRTDPPVVETVETTSTDATRVDATGELSDMGDMNSANVSFEYGPLYRQFVEDSESNEDKLIADGDFWESPEGYAHDDDYVHDNVPIEPGETRNYTFDQRGEDARIDGSLRTSEQTQPNGSVDSIEPVDDIEFIADNGLPDDGGTFNLTVEYEYLGTLMRFYVDGEEEQTWTGLGDYDEVYFSSYEYAGEERSNSLRMIQTERDPESVEEVSPDDDLTEQREFTSMLSGIVPDEKHEFRAFTDQNVDGHNVTDTGDFEIFATEGPDIESVGASAQSHRRIDVTGNLTRNDLNFADLFIEYAPVNRIFAEDNESNEDKLIADGDYWEDPDGYAHDEDYVHDNLPIKPGETRNYTVDNSDSDISKIKGSLRDSPQLQPNGSINSIDAVDDRERIRFTVDTLDDPETIEKRIEYDHDGSRIRIYINDEFETTWRGLDDYDELYFSSYEWGGDQNQDSLRLVRTDRDPESVETTAVDEDVDEDGEFTEKIGNLEDDTLYEFTPFTNQTIDEITVFDKGETILQPTETQGN